MTSNNQQGGEQKPGQGGQPPNQPNQPNQPRPSDK